MFGHQLVVLHCHTVIEFHHIILLRNCCHILILFVSKVLPILQIKLSGIIPAHIKGLPARHFLLVIHKAETIVYIDQGISL